MVRNKQRSRRRGKPRSRRSKILGAVGGAISPPPFVPTMSYAHKFRFTNGATAAVDVPVTRENLLNLVQIGASATTSARLFEAIRLRSVEMWTNPVALGSPPTTCSIEWLGENSPSVVVSDISMGVRPAHVRSLPPPASSNRWWSMSGSLESDDLFSLTLPANSIVDVIADCRVVEAENPTAGDGSTSLSAGKLYGGYLDGLSSGIFTPTGYNAVT